jgi:transcriptional regulator with XRE-family HTH domain
MTQVKSAQPATREVALQRRGDARTLAARRAAFAAQMRDMALSDLSEVSARLKQLHAELERKDGRKWTHYELAQAMAIAPRTFQSWENGEVENRDGKGYEKLARWYSRKLGRKITRPWIVFGDGAEGADLMDSLSDAEGSSLKRVEDRLAALETELLSKLGEVQTELEGLRQTIERPQRRKAGTRS